MTWKLPSTFALLTLFLAACSTSGAPGQTPGPTPGQTVAQAGFVTFVETPGGSYVGAEATYQSGFGSFSTVPAVPASDFSNAPEDVCTVFSPADEPPPAEEPEVTSLDAGEEITVTSGDATYAILRRVELDGTFSYSDNGYDPGQNLPPLPETALRVSIPGAAFPTFTADAPVAGATLSFTSPADLGIISPNSTFNWTPAPVAGARTSISFHAQQGLDAMTSVDIFCTLADDGAFNFSTQTQTEMQSKGFTLGELVGAGRTTSRTYFQGNAALVLSITRDTNVDSGGALGDAKAR